MCIPRTIGSRRGNGRGPRGVRAGMSCSQCRWMKTASQIRNIHTANDHSHRVRFRRRWWPGSRPACMSPTATSVRVTRRTCERRRTEVATGLAPHPRPRGEETWNRGMQGPRRIQRYAAGRTRAVAGGLIGVLGLRKCWLGLRCDCAPEHVSSGEGRTTGSGFCPGTGAQQSERGANHERARRRFVAAALGT